MRKIKSKLSKIANFFQSITMILRFFFSFWKQQNPSQSDSQKLIFYSSFTNCTSRIGFIRSNSLQSLICISIFFKNKKNQKIDLVIRKNFFFFLSCQSKRFLIDHRVKVWNYYDRNFTISINVNDAVVREL